MLEATDLGYRVGQRWLVSGASLKVRSGEFWALVGPNGAGKTTLLRMLGGELKPTHGEVRLDGRQLSEWRSVELARVRAFLSQHRQGNFPFTVREIVMMGRIPHLRGLRESAHDQAVVTEALRKVDMGGMAERAYPTLSGGEAARVDLARVLAQEPRLLLLDEPTNHLDLRHQFEVLALGRQLADDGCAVISVLHDLNLGALYADHMTLMRDGECVAHGDPEDVLTAELIEQTYGLQCKVWRHPSGCPWIVPHIGGQVPMPSGHPHVAIQETAPADESVSGGNRLSG
jgi:iron complex transport system ATP-binding protein